MTRQRSGHMYACHGGMRTAVSNGSLRGLYCRRSRPQPPLKQKGLRQYERGRIRWEGIGAFTWRGKPESVVVSPQFCTLDSVLAAPYESGNLHVRFILAQSSDEPNFS